MQPAAAADRQVSGAEPDLQEKLQQIALRLPGVEQGVACAGTSLESRTFLARKQKAFLFLRGNEARLKLRDSLAEAVALGKRSPALCQASASGWVKLTLAAGEKLPVELLRRWVAESHALVAAPARRSAPKKKVRSK